MTLLERSSRAAAVLLAPLFAAQLVLNRYANTTAVPPELLRPLLVLVGLSMIVFLLALAATRNPAIAALLASLLMVVLVIDPVPAVVLFGLTVWRLLVALLRRARHVRGPRLEQDPALRLASVYAVVLLGVGLWSAFIAQPGLREAPTLQPAPAVAGTGPDIYLLMLDGYPRLDTLRDVYNYDNTPFENELSDLGLTMALGARSNYNKTWLTQASMWSGQYVSELPDLQDPPQGVAAQARLAHELINDSAVLDDLRGRGYRVVSIPSQVMSTDLDTGADVKTTGDLSSLEIALASSTIVSWVAPQPVLEYIAGDMRTNAAGQLDLLQQEAERTDGQPKVVMTHLMPPHPPFVLGQDPDYLDGCFPRGCKVWAVTVDETMMSLDEYAGYLRSQVATLNDMVVDAVRTVVDADPDAVVIVYSDHGSRYSLDDLDEHFRVLFAARTPGQPNLFGNDVALVNVFRRILSGYFSEDLPDLPYRSWVSDWFLPLNLTERSP